MDFSSLLSSGSSLYIIGGGACVVFIVVLVLLTSKKAPQPQAVSTTQMAAPMASAVSQSVTTEENVLPSTDVIDVAPVVVATNAATPAIEPSKGEIPPLSSWKPSQDAAPVKSEEGESAPAMAPTEEIAPVPPQA